MGPAIRSWFSGREGVGHNDRTGRSLPRARGLTDQHLGSALDRRRYAKPCPLFLLEWSGEWAFLVQGTVCKSAEERAGAKGSRSRAGSWRGGYPDLRVPDGAVSQPFLRSCLSLASWEASIPPQGTPGASPTPPFSVSPDPSGTPLGTGWELTPICFFWIG